MTDFPFRTEPHIADAETLARLNREQGRTGASAFESAEKALARIRAMSHIGGGAFLRSWSTPMSAFAAP